MPIICCNTYLKNLYFCYAGLATFFIIQYSQNNFLIPNTVFNGFLPAFCAG